MYKAVEVCGELVVQNYIYITNIHYNVFAILQYYEGV